MVDTADSKSADRKVMPVRVRPPLPERNKRVCSLFCKTLFSFQRGHPGGNSRRCGTNALFKQYGEHLNAKHADALLPAVQERNAEYGL